MPKYISGDSDSSKDIGNISDCVHDNTHKFVFVFMNECPHCVNVKPVWDSITPLNNDNTSLIRISAENYPQLQTGTASPTLLPHFQYISPGHGKVDNSYNGTREKESLANWINGAKRKKRNHSRKKTGGLVKRRRNSGKTKSGKRNLGKRNSRKRNSGKRKIKQK